LAEACASSRGGDRAAFDQLHARLGPGIRAFFAKRTRNGRGRDVVDDLCQRVWLGLFEAFAQGRYDPARSSIATFVYAIAAKTWLRYLRQAGRAEQGAGMSGRADNRVAIEDDVEVLPAGDEPDAEVGAAELLEAIRRCLRERGTPGALTDEEQAIIVAAASGASDRTLAERLGLAASTVNAKKQAGWEKLRRYLARLGHRTDSGERDQVSRE
jgi:RNA polymerase sigma factor (sigma-70 family)